MCACASASPPPQINTPECCQNKRCKKQRGLLVMFGSSARPADATLATRLAGWKKMLGFSANIGLKGWLDDILAGQNVW